MNSSADKRTLRVALAGGGTGGHIIPALAIAEELQRSIHEQGVFNAVKFLFFGSDYGMETKMIPEAGFKLEALPIRGLSRSMNLAGIKQNLLLPGRLIISVLRANKAIAAFKPHIIIGTGGYASGVPVRQAFRRNIPVVLQEQNSYPGLVTRLFASKAKQVFLTYNDAAQYLGAANVLLTGNPIRHLSTGIDRTEAAKFFNMDPALPTLFILGGSQGARTLNRHFANKVSIYLEKLDMQILWQTGRADIEYCKKQVGANPRIHLVPFINDMDKAYALANLMVCRAGAMTLTEINHFCLPSILIPLPSAAANHQEFNARSQESAGAAQVVLESELADGALLPILTEIFTNREILGKMSKASAALSKPDAARTICDTIIKIASTCA